MPSIRITDRLGAIIDAQLAPGSALLKYAGAVPSAVIQGADLSRLQGLMLNDPAVRSLQFGFAFNQPVDLGKDAPSLTFRAESAGSLRVTAATAADGVLPPTDDYGEEIEVPPGRIYAAIGLKGLAGARAEAATGPLTFGVEAGADVALTYYAPFPGGADAPTLAEALARCVAELILPADVEDLRSLAGGALVTIGGHGALKFSGTANLLAIANPLAGLALPSPAPAIAVNQGASVDVGASWQISTEYHVRIRKVDSRRVQIGWYRKRGSEAEITVSASTGVSTSLGSTDLFPMLISAISSDARADLEQLRKAGLPAEEAARISDAVKSAVNRKLQVGMAAEFGALGSHEAAFLYEVELMALDAAGEERIRAALQGVLGAFTGSGRLPAGVTELRSILTTANSSRFSMKLNLLGIFNYGSVSQLALSGTVTFTPSTGELVIADEATASRIQSSAVNFGADEDKLRKVMAESFLATAAYRGSKSVVSPPKLASSHLFFAMDSRTSREELRRFAAIAPALNLSAANLPEGTSDFGRTSVFAEARYDDALSRSLFYRAGGAPRPHADYEAAGRRAIALLVPSGADDAFRLPPTADDALWDRMKDLGPANFRQLFPPLHAEVIGADYLAIQWWADAMCGAARILAQMDRYTAGGNAVPDDPEFQRLRLDLAHHLRDVAAKAHAQFGAPWGLVAMFLISGSAETALQITGPRFVYTAGQMLRAAG
ncbi:MAG: hypothetical protein LAQ30_06775 [Acidobacteriia bacterium]|nr:hypothetical protein [Terriglobia bacterium]